MKKIIISFLIVIACFQSTYAQNAEAKFDLKSMDIPIDSIQLLIHKLENKQNQLDLYFQLIQYYGEKGLFEKGIDIISTIPINFKVQSKPLYEELYAAYYKKEGMSHLKEKLQLIEDDILRDFIIEKIFFLAIMNQSEDAELLLPILSQNVIKTRINLYLVEFYCKDNQLDKANDILDEIQFPSQKDMAYSYISLSYGKNMDYDRANQMLNSIFDPKIKNQTLVKLIEEFSNKAMFNLAYEYLNMITPSEYYEKSLLVVIKAYLDQDKFESAYQLFQSLKSDQIRQESLYYLTIYLASQSEFERVNNAIARINIESILVDTVHSSVLIYAKNNYFTYEEPNFQGHSRIKDTSGCFNGFFIIPQKNNPGFCVSIFIPCNIP